MRLHYNANKKIFFCIPVHDDIQIVRRAGLKKNVDYPWVWQTRDIYCAMKLVEYAQYHVKEFLERQMAKWRTSYIKSKALDSNISIPSPEGLSYKSYQKAGIAFMLSKRFCLNADDMRLGKTIQTAGYINHNYMTDKCKILIICPATLKINWYNELDKWLMNKSLKIVVCTSKFFPDNENIFIINYEGLKNWEKKVKEIKWDLVVCDEAHYLKSPISERKKVVFGDDKRRKKIPCKNMILLTGSPIVNYPIEIFPLLKALDVPFAQDFQKFVDRYTDKSFNGFGWTYKGGKRLKELQIRLRQTVMIRRLKSEVKKDLPPKIRQIVEVELKNALLKEKDLLQDHEKKRSKLEKSFNKSEYEKAVIALEDFDLVSFNDMAAIRHETALLKVPLVVEHCKMLLETTEKIVVFAHHTDVIKKVFVELKEYNPIVIDGAVKVKERISTIENRFLNGDSRVCIAGIMISQGFSLSVSDVAVFAELDWVPGNMSQAEDRLYSMNKTGGSILIQHIVINGSIDARMAKLLIKKQGLIDKSLN